MGMDVYGKAPRSEAGEYFRNNVWGWHPLAEYIQIVAPTIAAHCKYWHSNDGHGLNDEMSKDLARVLDERIASGECKAYFDLHKEGQDMVENVRNFSAFLKDCGGFEIC